MPKICAHLTTQERAVVMTMRDDQCSMRSIAYRTMTEAAEALGLFSETNRIGFRVQWHGLIRERGYELIEGQLRPLANVNEDSGQTCALSEEEGIGVHRHLTALTRSNFSAPVQALMRHGLVGQNTIFFDYGCGKGDDVRNLCVNGVLQLWG